MTGVIFSEATRATLSTHNGAMYPIMSPTPFMLDLLWSSVEPASPRKSWLFLEALAVYYPGVEREALLGRKKHLDNYICITEGLDEALKAGFPGSSEKSFFTARQWFNPKHHREFKRYEPVDEVRDDETSGRHWLLSEAYEKDLAAFHATEMSQDKKLAASHAKDARSVAEFIAASGKGK